MIANLFVPWEERGEERGKRVRVCVWGDFSSPPALCALQNCTAGPLPSDYLLLVVGSDREIDLSPFLLLGIPDNTSLLLVPTS